MTYPPNSNYRSPWHRLNDEMSEVLQNEFGEWVEHHPRIRDIDVNSNARPYAEPQRIFAIFDDRHTDVLTALENDTSTTDPWLSVRKCDFNIQPSQDDKFIVRCEAYEATDIQPDGQFRYRIKLVKLEL